MDASFSLVYQVIAGILVLASVIFFHELGHFLMARALNIGVVTFSIGFGPKLLKYKTDRTEYCISLIPLGGYCALVGEYDKEVEEIGFTQEEALTNRPPLHKLLLAAAGPFANILLSFVIYFGIALHSGSTIVLPVVGDVMPESAAQEAGLQKGDFISKLAEKELHEWNEISEIITNMNGEEVKIEFIRNDNIFTATLTPKKDVRTNVFGEEEFVYLLGVTPLGETKHSPLGFFGALQDGVKQTVFMLDMTLTGLKKMVTGSVSADNIGGPILIAKVLGEQASVGIIPLLLFAALISINLGILNLLPIPVLDGGTIVFSIIEMIIRRPISEAIQERLMQGGAFLLLCLMVFATFNDVMRFFK